MHQQLREIIEYRYACRLSGKPQKLTDGDECDVWHWSSDRGDLVVRISPAWRTLAELRWVHSLSRHCAGQIAAVVAPLPASGGTTIFQFQEHPVAVFPFRAGSALNTENRELCVAAARLLGRIHTVAQTWTKATNRPSSRATTPQPLPPERYPAELVDPELDAWYAALLQSETVTIGPHHGDFYARNVLCEDGHIVGVIDWDESTVNPLILETGWSAWEFSQTTSQDDLDDHKARAFLAAYLQAGPLVSAELNGAIPAIRWRLRSEAVRALAAAERGEDWDEAYTTREMVAFQRLHGRTL